MKFNCGLLLQKLVRVQLCPDGLWTFKIKAMGSSKQQNTSVYSYARVNFVWNVTHMIFSIVCISVGWYGYIPVFLGRYCVNVAQVF